MNMDLQPAYENSLYSYENEVEEVIFEREKCVQGDAPVQCFAIVTAFNPGYERPNPEQNAEANARLEQWLTKQQFTFTKAKGYAKDESHVEPSFAVFEVSADEALLVALYFGQAAIYYWDGRKGKVLYTKDLKRNAEMQQN